MSLGAVVSTFVRKAFHTALVPSKRALTEATHRIGVAERELSALRDQRDRAGRKGDLVAKCGLDDQVFRKEGEVIRYRIALKDLQRQGDHHQRMAQ